MCVSFKISQELGRKGSIYALGENLWSGEGKGPARHFKNTSLAKPVLYESWNFKKRGGKKKPKQILKDLETVSWKGKSYSQPDLGKENLS